MTDSEKLAALLDRWERQPDIMLFGAGTNTSGVVAKWIRDATRQQDHAGPVPTLADLATDFRGNIND